METNNIKKIAAERMKKLGKTEAIAFKLLEQLEADGLTEEEVLRVASIFHETAKKAVALNRETHKFKLPERTSLQSI